MEKFKIGDYVRGEGMKKFEIGDKVKMSNNCRFTNDSGQKIGTIIDIIDNYLNSNVKLIYGEFVYRIFWIDGIKTHLYFEKEIELFEWNEDILKEKLKRMDDARLEHILEDPYGEENWI